MDGSERLADERTVDAREERLHLWNRTLVGLAKSPAIESGDFEAALRDITEAATRTLGVARSSLWEYLPEHAGIRCLDLYERDTDSHSSGVELFAVDFPKYFAALETERTIAAHDAHTHPSTAEFSEVYLKPLGIGAMLDAPTRERGRMVGVICNEHVGEARVWTFEEQSFAGSLADFVAIARESAERRRAERALEARVAELARSNAELEQFAYVASHDLQEPLRMVSSYVSLLERKYRGKLDEDADRYIGYAVDGARRMHDLINDLLAYSRAGRDELEASAVDAGAACDAALANLEARIGATSARVERGELPGVHGRATQLTQIFQNLIENGLKYSREGTTPVVRIESRTLGDQVEFRVSDNGIGIEPRHHDRIFRIFQRLHDRTTYQGSGIGLAIAKRIVDGMGGSIGVESDVGEGATFWFRVPSTKTKAAS